MIGLEQYAKIKNNYCLGYFGNCNEYLVQLKLLKPAFERRFPGLNLYLACKDECFHYLDGYEHAVKLSDLKIRRSEFGHIKELRFNGQEHPVSLLLKDSGISSYAVPVTPPEDHTVLCVIISKSVYPTSPLIQAQIKTLTRIAREKGYEVEVDGDWQSAGMVMGVESVGLFSAAAKGLSTTLVPTGVGEHLYKNMFPDGKILNP